MTSDSSLWRTALARRCRAMAGEAAALAKLQDDPGARRDYETLAAEWRRLAHAIEAESAEEDP